MKDEKLRLQNIERNQQFLEQIGLSPPVKRETTASTRKPKRKVEPPRLPPAEFLRRSNRVATLGTTISYKEQDLTSSRSTSRFGTAAESDEAAADDNNDLPYPRSKKPSAPSGPRPPPTADSSRAIDCQLTMFLTDDMLGKPIESFGKAAVMTVGNNGSLPRFSKYSGVCEWRNCIFLWVNLGMNSDYINTFRNDGRCITWYGGSKMHEESDVVKRLITAGNVKTENDSVILFVRLEGESYACLGRCAHRSYVLDKHPIEFEWELLDYDRMKDSSHFKRYLNC